MEDVPARSFAWAICIPSRENAPIGGLERLGGGGVNICANMVYSGAEKAVYLHTLCLTTQPGYRYLFALCI